ncbi:MAG TPA: DUF4845 domain-containing protein [Steroidobacteraceae bacterium]|nr:DUF4845 domain-containing protein [Steroidobacteraceae bacterium]
MRDRLKRRERGMTTVGLIILVAFVGLFVYAGIRLLPIYLEYFNVLRSVEGLKSDAESGLRQMQISLEKRFDIEDIKSLNYKDIEIKKEGGGWSAHIEYDAQTPFVGNVGFVVHFDKTVLLAGSGGP